MIPKLAWLALAGALGTLTRYEMAGLVHRFVGPEFPWGTLVVNFTGAFLAGLLWTLFQGRWAVSGETRTLILVGFMGAFTTFSSMILESGELLRSSGWAYAAANLTMQNTLGFVAFFAGVAVAQLGA
jgi:CrcB protein